MDTHRINKRVTERERVYKDTRRKKWSDINYDM